MLDEAAPPTLAHGDGVDGDHARRTVLPPYEKALATGGEPMPPEFGDGLAFVRDVELTDEDLAEARAFMGEHGLEGVTVRLAAVLIKKLREWDDFQQRRSRR
jgi:hypothetical protein